MAVMTSTEKIVRLRSALIRLVGTDDEKELKKMKAYLHVLPNTAARSRSIYAVHALIDTK